MRTGFAILAHERLDRVAQVANHLGRAGAPVVIHVDRRVAEAQIARLRADLEGRAQVISTRKAEWGTFSLVEATLDCVGVLLEQAARIDHICLLSGTCVPVRPLGELSAFLARNPGVDFIESVPVQAQTWIKGGLSGERFSLWFPVSWRRRRGLFNALVSLQRWLGIRRGMPDGLEPHLGLQWWCVSVPTLQRLMQNRRLAAYKRFFRWTWIPDEGFFQTVLRADPEARIRSEPLTLQRFDGDGRPTIFYDDHLAWLETSEFFLARKIDPDAEQIYARLLDPARPSRAHDAAGRVAFEGEGYDRADEGYGSTSPGRFPHHVSAVRVETVRPYLVVVSEDNALMQRLRERLVSEMTRIRWHGRLFGAGDAEFAGGGAEYRGNLSGAPALRDYRPAQFLARLVFTDRDEGMGFLFHPGDDAQVAAQISRDPNARLLLLADGGTDALLARLRAPEPRKAGRRASKPAELNAAWRAVSAKAIGLALDAGTFTAGAAFGVDLALEDWDDRAQWQTATGAEVTS